MRAIECPCGHQFEAADDDELFRLCREHVDRDHPRWSGQTSSRKRGSRRRLRCRAGLMPAAGPHVIDRVDDLLARARRSLTRLDPAAALEAMRAGATLIDIRAESQIAEGG